MLFQDHIKKELHEQKNKLSGNPTGECSTRISILLFSNGGCRSEISLYWHKNRIHKWGAH